MSGDELRGSAPVMSTKDILIEVYRDMKFVRPAVEGLLAAGVVARIEALEREDIAAKALGINDNLITRVAVLENINDNKVAADLERRRIGDLTNKGIAIIVLVSNFVLGTIVVFANLFSEKLPT